MRNERGGVLLVLLVLLLVPVVAAGTIWVGWSFFMAPPAGVAFHRDAETEARAQEAADALERAMSGRSGQKLILTEDQVSALVGQAVHDATDGQWQGAAAIEGKQVVICIQGVVVEDKPATLVLKVVLALSEEGLHLKVTGIKVGKLPVPLGIISRILERAPGLPPEISYYPDRHTFVLGFEALTDLGQCAILKVGDGQVIIEPK